MRNRSRVLLGLSLIITGCAVHPPAPIAGPTKGPDTSLEPESDKTVRASVLGGEAPVPVPPQSIQFNPKSGDISLNFPAADVHVVAKAVLGDILRVPWSVSADVNQPVTVVTMRPISRASLIPFLENALRTAGLAMVAQDGGFSIMPIATARSSGTVAPAVGYGTEIVQLQFVSAEEMRKLLESVIPGTVASIDASHNSMVIAGTTGQRESARSLLEQFDVNWLRNMNFAMLVPQRTDARLIVPELEKLLNGPDSPTRGLVRIIAMEKLNGILAISAQRQYLDDVRRWIEILDREGESNQRRLFVYNVQNGRARDLAKTLNTAFGKSAGGSSQTPGTDPFGTAQTDAPQHAAAVPSPAAGPRAANGNGEAGANESGGTITATISADETNNAIIVFGTAREYAVVEEALRKLDVLPYQVLIEAAITEVTLTDDLRFGVNWNFQTGASNFALSAGATATPGRIFPGFSYFYSNNNDISGTLNALEQRTNVKVVSAPKLLVLNNQTAALQVGDQVPVSSQSAVSVQNPDSPIVNSIEYRDTGVILKVTPRVNGSGLVLLDIAQEVSDVSTNKTSDINSPVISTRRIATSVAVQDGQVIALGGLFKDAKTFGKDGLPILSRIPVIGGLLFGSHNDTQKRTELLVILKPRVLRTIDDGRAVTEELRAKLRTLEPFRTEGRIP